MSGADAFGARPASWLLCAFGAALCACGESGPAYESLLAESYPTGFAAMRPCRPSSDHDLTNVKIFADQTAAPTYLDRMGEFPVGSVVVKEEYDLDDTACTGPVVLWTVMSKLAAGTSTLTSDWRWQRIGRDRKVATQDEKRCINCHADCGGPPFGYNGTCSEP